MVNNYTEYIINEKTPAVKRAQKIFGSLPKSDRFAFRRQIVERRDVGISPCALYTELLTLYDVKKGHPSGVSFFYVA